jgi:hypothetical protein
MRLFTLGAAIALALGLLWGFAGTFGSAQAQTGEDAPEISNIAATTTSTTATITWTTDATSTSQVAYGTTIDYSQYSTFNASLVEDHSVFLSNLTPDTLYHFQVISGLSTTSTSTENVATSTDRTFVTLETSSGTSTPPIDLEWLKEKIHELLTRVGILEDQVDEIFDIIDDDNGNGTTTPPTGDAIIEQDGAEVRAGTNIDFAGRNFGPEELVTIEREGSPIGRTAFTNLAGSFTTGSITVPTTLGSYTYTFEGQESGEVAEAEIEVIP